MDILKIGKGKGMKKRIASYLAILVSFASAQADLRDIYKKGEVRLAPNRGFAKNLNWKDLLGEVGFSLAIGDDGTIYLSDYVHERILTIDTEGNLQSLFSTKKEHSPRLKKPGNLPVLSCVLNNKYLLVKGHNSICIFTKDGRMVKTIKIDDPIIDSIGIGKEKIAFVLASVIKNKEVNHRVILRDIKNKGEKILASFSSNLKDQFLTFKSDNGMISVGLPAFIKKTFLRRTLDGNLIIGYSGSPEISIYSASGAKIRAFQLDYEPLPVSQEAVDQYFRNVQESGKNHNLPEAMLEDVKRQLTLLPKKLPYFYEMVVDSEGNILIFIFSNEKEKYIFRVYSPLGEFICQSSLIPLDYKIGLNPPFRTLAFFGNNLFALAQGKSGNHNYFQLIKTNLEIISEK